MERYISSRYTKLVDDSRQTLAVGVAKHRSHGTSWGKQNGEGGDCTVPHRRHCTQTVPRLMGLTTIPVRTTKPELGSLAQRWGKGGENCRRHRHGDQGRLPQALVKRGWVWGLLGGRTTTYCLIPRSVKNRRGLRTVPLRDAAHAEQLICRYYYLLQPKSLIVPKESTGRGALLARP